MSAAWTSLCLLEDIIAIRLTSTARDLPTWVKLPPAGPLTGYANADYIEQLGKDELGNYSALCHRPPSAA